MSRERQDDTADWRRIKADIKRISPRFGWWGDDLDIRFVLIRMLRDIGPARVLDIGCGIGVILSEVDASACRVGLDISREALTRARLREEDLSLCQGSVYHLPLRDASFDRIILAHVIETIPLDRLESLLAEIRRVMKPGGRFLATLPNIHHWCYQGKFPLEHGQLAGLLARAGFQFRIWGYNPSPSLVFFLPAAIRQRIPSRFRPLLSPFPWFISRIAWMRRMMEWIMWKGWGLAASKSLLVVAEKTGNGGPSGRGTGRRDAAFQNALSGRNRGETGPR